MDFTPAEVDRDYMPTVEVICDLADGLWQMNEMIEGKFAGKMPLFDLAVRKELRETIAKDFIAEKDDQA